MLKAHTTFTYDLCSTHTLSLLVSVLRFDDSFFQFPANPLLLPLAVTRNFSLHFIFNVSFQSISEDPGVEEEGAPRCSSTPGAKFPLPFFLTPLSFFFLFVLGGLFFINPFNNFKKFFYTNSMCVWVLGGLWKLIYESTTFLFSCHLPLEWVCRPRAFFH